MLVFVVLEAHRLIIIERVRIIIDRLPFVVALGECDLLLRDIHFDSAGDSGVDFLLCGREDYIECLFASIADRGFCIVLIRPCERALNRLAVKGCRAAVQFEVEQLIAVGGAKIFQIECRLVLIRSLGCNDSNAGIECNRPLFAEVLDGHSRVGIQHVVIVRGGQGKDKGIGRVRLELVGCRNSGQRARIALALIPEGNGVQIIRAVFHVTNGHALAEADDGHGGSGDGLLGDREFCRFASGAVRAIRHCNDSICTSVCKHTGAFNLQLSSIDRKAGVRRVVRAFLLNLKADKAGNILSGARLCAQRELFAAGITSRRVRSDGDLADGRGYAVYRNLCFLSVVSDSLNGRKIYIFNIESNFIVFTVKGHIICSSFNFFCTCLILDREHYPRKRCSLICRNRNIEIDSFNQDFPNLGLFAFNHRTGIWRHSRANGFSSGCKSIRLQCCCVITNEKIIV